VISIEVPLLRGLERELKEKGELTLNLAADENVSRVLKAQVGVSSESLFFLADADRKLVESLALSVLSGGFEMVPRTGRILCN
jgi:hypothetical protein